MPAFASDQALERELADLGGFFPAHVHPFDAGPSGHWQALTTLLDDPQRLAERVDQVRRTLGPRATARVAASVAQLGLVARLLAPTLAASVLGYGSLSLDPARLWWQDELSGAFPLSVARSPAGAEQAREPTGAVVAALTAQVQQNYRVSARTLWGNVGSAVNTAARLLTEYRPDRAPAAKSYADGMLADARIDGGRLRTGPSFRRRSCCLIYQVAGHRGALCEDCVLIG